jgi:cell division protein FtsN
VNHRYSDANDIDDYRNSGEREITLHAATILGIFFLLVLICAVFFGFGYTLGRKSAPLPNAETLATPAPIAVPSSNSKPSATSRTVDLPTRTSAGTEASTPPPNQLAQPTQAPDETAASATSQQISVPITNPSPVPARRTPVEAVPATPRPALAPVTSSFVVQIAAVSHQEDADVLRTALEPRGYHVNIIRVPQDKLFHVQVGPFANRKDADAMRQRLLNDGYNAIVK